MDEFPLPPNGHPMRGYAEHMTKEVEALRFMVFCLILLALMAAIAFMVFAYQKWKERKEIKKMRTDVVDLTVACGTILAGVKARGEIIDQKVEQKDMKVAEAAQQMRDAVKELPEKTSELSAKKVVQALEDRDGTDPGHAKTGSP